MITKNNRVHIYDLQENYAFSNGNTNGIITFKVRGKDQDNFNKIKSNLNKEGLKVEEVFKSAVKPTYF